MTTPALVTLVLAAVVLFGGLAASIAHAVVAERRRSGRRQDGQERASGGVG